MALKNVFEMQIKLPNSSHLTPVDYNFAAFLSQLEIRGELRGSLVAQTQLERRVLCKSLLSAGGPAPVVCSTSWR